MKKIAFLFFVGAGFFSCQNQAKTLKQERLGGDRDRHGCIGSAGYTWSVLRRECVQVFEVGQRLNPTEQNPNEAVISAFVILNADKTKAELFLPNEKQSIILTKKGNVFSHEKYQYSDEKNLISLKGKTIFQK